MNRAVILIVDDEATNLRYAAQILSGEHTVKACRSGEDALRAVESTEVDLILLDVHMEHMDGFQVARILQSSPQTREIPLIFLTADNSKEMLLKGFSLGGKDFITKPFNREELLARVGTHIALYHHIREQKRLLEIIKEQSITDELTGLHNRKAFRERMTEQIAQFRRYRIPFSILILDIDHFKKINDSYGHQKGDEVLVALSGVLRSISRVTDYPFRFGGEEFLIISANTKRENAVPFAEKIRETIQREVKSVGDKGIGVSIGVAEFTEEDDNEQDSLIKRADDNLYRAKEGGRNRVVS